MAEASRDGGKRPSPSRLPTCGFVLPPVVPPGASASPSDAQNGRSGARHTGSRSAGARVSLGPSPDGGLHFPGGTARRRAELGRPLRGRAEGGDLPAGRRAQVGRGAEAAGTCSSQPKAPSGNPSVGPAEGELQLPGCGGKERAGRRLRAGGTKGNLPPVLPAVVSSGKEAAAAAAGGRPGPSGGGGRDGRERRRTASLRAGGEPPGVAPLFGAREAPPGR